MPTALALYFYLPRLRQSIPQPVYTVSSHLICVFLISFNCMPDSENTKAEVSCPREAPHGIKIKGMGKQSEVAKGLAVTSLKLVFCILYWF